VYCGYDENFAHNVLSGGAGCIGALSNLVPEICSKRVAAFKSNDLPETLRIQKYMNRLMEFYSICIPFMPAMKRALCKRGIPVSQWCTYPLLELSQQQELRLECLMKKLNII
jgi:4-hydroxy-tetrahydrodipicolinate synthase